MDMSTKVVLGRGGLRVSPIGLGCMVLSGMYGVPDPDESVATFELALELGITLLDTADHYAAGENEQLLGRLLRGRRDQVVLSSKMGLVRGDKGTAVDARPERVRPCIDSSLERLGVDHLDLWYLHRADPRVPIEETVGAMADEVRAGKALHLGLCEVSPAELRRAAAVHPIAALQSEWSLVSRELERGCVAAARELGVGIVPFSPLGRGFLNGAITASSRFAPDDPRSHDPRFLTPHLETNVRLLDVLVELAAGKGATTGQVALAWLKAQGDDVVPIPGAERRVFLTDAVGALSVTLDVDELAALDRTFFDGAMAGDASAAHLRTWSLPSP
jgi:aryl-alcohol dehydrogenase-like predicted oxidoreductase